MGESSATYQGCVLPNTTLLLGSALARDEDGDFTVTVSPPSGDVTSWGADMALTLLLSTIWEPFEPPDVVRGRLGFV